jgi:hypothetical protein
LGYLDTTFPERLHLSTSMASRLFKVVGVGAAMPRLTLVASSQCHLHSLVSASTVWPGTTSHCLFCLSTKHQARNCKRRRPPRCLSSDHVQERTHTHANSVWVARALTTATVATSLLARLNRAGTKVLSWRLLSLLARFFARQLRCWRLRVAVHSLPRTRHTMARTEPRRGLWGAPMSSVVNACGACRTVIVATAAPQQQLAGITSLGDVDSRPNVEVLVMQRIVEPAAYGADHPPVVLVALVDGDQLVTRRSSRHTLP